MYDCATLRSVILLAALQVIILLGVCSEKAHADALGLPDGLYEIRLSSIIGFTGTMRIGPAPGFVTFFDIAPFSCTGCEELTSTPDLVIINDASRFVIRDQTGLSDRTLNLEPAGVGEETVVPGCPPPFPIPIPCFPLPTIFDISWTATAIPEAVAVAEPSTLLLGGIGLLSLFLRRRRES